jgi:hypothetical protein
MKLAAVTNSHFEHTNKNGNAMIAFSGVDEIKDNQSRSVAVESVPAPRSSVENLMSRSSGEVSLISAWDSISEQLLSKALLLSRPPIRRARCEGIILLSEKFPFFRYYVSWTGAVVI